MKGPSSIGGAKNSPGPGAYQMRTSFENIVGSKIGTENRDKNFKEIQRVSSPGPAAYSIKTTISKNAVTQSAPMFGFGTETRSNRGSMTSLKVPGPGQY